MDNVEYRLNELDRRIEKIESQVENNTELIVSVKELATEVKYMRAELTALNGRVKEIESKPAKRWENLVAQILSIIVAGIGGVILGRMVSGL